MVSKDYEAQHLKYSEHTIIRIKETVPSEIHWSDKQLELE